MLIRYLQCSHPVAYWGNMSAFLKGNKLIALAGFFFLSSIDLCILQAGLSSTALSNVFLKP